MEEKKALLIAKKIAWLDLEYTLNLEKNQKILEDISKCSEMCNHDLCILINGNISYCLLCNKVNDSNEITSKHVIDFDKLLDDDYVNYYDYRTIVFKVIDESRKMVINMILNDNSIEELENAVINKIKDVINNYYSLEDVEREK